MALPAWWCRGGRGSSTTSGCSPISTSRLIRPTWRRLSPRVNGSRKTKTARFFRAVFSSHKPALLFAVAEAPRPPSGAAGLGVGGRLGSGLRSWCRSRLAVVDRRGRVRLGIDRETHLLAHRRATPRRGPFGLLCALRLSGCSWLFRLAAIRQWLLWRRRNGFGLHHRQRRLRRISVEIGNGARHLRRRCRPEFVHNRSGQTVLRPAPPAASAATSATAGPPLALCGLIGANHAGLLLAFVTRRAIFACLAAPAAPPPTPLAPRTFGSGFGAGLFAAGGIPGEPFGLFGFHLRFDFDVERLVLVECFLQLRRERCHLRRQQRLGGLQRVHLFAAIDDKGLLAGYRRVGDHRKGYLEAVLEVAQMAALVIENVKRDIGSGPHHEIVGRALHQYFLKAAQQLQGHRGNRTYMAAAAALRAGLGRTLQHAGADALARHLEQSEMRDASDLDSGAVLPEAIAELALHRTVVALLVHVDEVDDDQAGEVA